MKGKQPQWLKNEKLRLLQLWKYNILDSEPEQEFDDIVELASQICNVPISLVSLIDDSRQWFKAHKGLNISEIPREFSFCAHAIEGKLDLLEIENASLDQRFADNPFVKGEPHIRFYAGYPLITPGGHKLGTLCVIDTKPRQLNENQRFTLKILSHQVINLLELRIKNQQLNHSLEKAQLTCRIGFFEVDLQKDIWICSEAFFHMLGLEKKSEFSFNDFKRTIHPEDRKITLQHWHKCLKNQDHFDFEYRSLHKATQQLLYIHNRCEIIREKNGQPIKLAGFIENVSDKVNREKFLVKQNEELKRVNQELDSFVYRISHDLRAPVASGKGLIEVMRNAKDFDPSQIDLMLDLLTQCLHNEDLLIRDISDYFYDLREPLDCKIIDFNSLIEDVTDQYQERLKAKKIQTKIIVAQKGIYQSDYKRLFIILNGLVSNAVQFTKTNNTPSFIEIDVDASENQALLIVKDNGTGIEEEHKDKIYNMFYRATEQSAGAGLGLYIVKSAVTNLQGSIKLNSTRNLGSTFEILLPALT